MKTIVALALTIVTLPMMECASADGRIAPAGARLAQASPERACAQVISCGTKNGERKEYPTPCAAQDDGAADIAPKTGPTCGDSK